MALTGETIVRDAAIEVNAIAPTEPLKPGVAQFLLGQLSRIIDDWNAIRSAVYATEFLSFPFVPNLNPHTIGPTGTWVVPQRPVTIEGATVVLTGTVNAPQIWMHDQSVGIPTWFQSLTTPNITTSYPTDGYYDATWPNGSLYLWPIPSLVYNCQIQVRSVLTEYALSTPFSMPPGYRDAITLTLAENSSEGLGRPLSPVLQRRALMARVRIFGNNTGGGQIITRDAGMTTRRGTRSNWNWLCGLIGR